MKRPNRSNPVALALWANAVVLVGILAVILCRGNGLQITAPAFGENVSIAGSGVYIMPAQLYNNSWGCYMLDVDKQTIVVYQYQPGDKALRLVAARNYKFDRELKNMNTFPMPREIERLVEQEKHPRGGAEPAPAPVTPQDPPTDK